MLDFSFFVTVDTSVVCLVSFYLVHIYVLSGTLIISVYDGWKVCVRPSVLMYTGTEEAIYEDVTFPFFMDSETARIANSIFV